MNWQRLRLVLGLALIVLVMVSCGGGGATPTPIVLVVTAAPSGAAVITVVVTSPPPEATPTGEAAQPPPAVTGIEIKEATFAHGLTEDMQPVDPGSDFRPDETVYLSLQLKGRPEEGVVTSRFYWHDSLIAEASVDLADVNSGVLFSVGEDTYVGYTLTHDEPFPLSDQYRAEVFYGDQPAGTHPFRVVAPAEAIPSEVKEVTLALGANENYEPIDPTSSFAPDQEVYLVGAGDLGLSTWLQADWYVNGTLDEAGTRGLTLDQNITDAGFQFTYLPEGGWPVGEHYVVLTMNDQEVGRYTFTVVSP
jgi:hypothetical protein